MVPERQHVGGGRLTVEPHGFARLGGVAHRYRRARAGGGHGGADLRLRELVDRRPGPEAIAIGEALIGVQQFRRGALGQTLRLGAVSLDLGARGRIAQRDAGHQFGVLRPRPLQFGQRAGAALVEARPGVAHLGFVIGDQPALALVGQAPLADQRGLKLRFQAARHRIADRLRPRRRRLRRRRPRSRQN